MDRAFRPPPGDRRPSRTGIVIEQIDVERMSGFVGESVTQICVGVQVTHIDFGCP